jgi:predicted amidohydrolase
LNSWSKEVYRVRGQSGISALNIPGIRSYLTKVESARRDAASPDVSLREGDQTLDASLMIGSDGRVHCASKTVHVAQLPRFHEQGYYMPSDSGFRTYQTRCGTVGIVVCFDRHFPESTRA